RDGSAAEDAAEQLRSALVEECRELPLARRVLHELAQRQPRRPFAVGDAAAHSDARSVLEPGRKLDRKPSLADARVAENREDSRSAVRADIGEGGAERIELLLAPDEGRPRDTLTTALLLDSVDAEDLHRLEPSADGDRAE